MGPDGALRAWQQAGDTQALFISSNTVLRTAGSDTAAFRANQLALARAANGITPEPSLPPLSEVSNVTPSQ